MPASFSISIVIDGLTDIRRKVKVQTHRSRTIMQNCDMALFLMNET